MYTVPELKYGYDALGSYISADIMKLHHDKHHQTYVDKLNKAIDDAPALRERPLESLLAELDSLPDTVQQAVRNNGGGHLNHTLFWQWMSPDGGGEPTGALAKDIEDKYGSFQQFVDAFSAKSLSVFGSGWVWLQPNLDIITTANQDNPLMSGGDAPLLGLDVWEHAYYLDYKNKRDDYVQAWWNVVDWNFVAGRRDI
ncbi:superoxide dismutase [Candidatus Saccharibacteria bacterium RIFCSPHIGHO2_01_FULL_45_15]|nr:MAG: superoxide dismutase [Candidatus Saccharibacteria bacterium RIFCSPHIGHO2_01_FULL_45_15]OGL27419.1 MAG: superoxide dismutase [Candidatus Saccharibacteria bacterium RIFCSPHIGHO2_02_FULL_46_12]OGL32636.1 MAG: superoxide dismutase [Candidatus Saccharibacteria bacterium RIFCSPHIGHO2_12_FULL_44_22]